MPIRGQFCLPIDRFGRNRLKTARNGRRIAQARLRKLQVSILRRFPVIAARLRDRHTNARPPSEPLARLHQAEVHQLAA
jgi:hypothetical protein